MKNISRRNIGGFTLVEILVVVLIIGILSAVAIPMYQGAVDKSRFGTLLPTAKSIKDAEEAMRMSTGLYTDQMEDLDISMENGELTFTFDIHNNLVDPSLFRVTDPKLENVRLASYFDFNPMMAGQKHCEAKTGDERANRLCGPLLQGQELGSTDDGYNRYLLDDDIDKATCDGISRTWSNKQSKCYKTEEDRCIANGMPYKDGFCGYINAAEGTVIDEGGSCKVEYNYGCRGITVQNGGTCWAYHTGAGGDYPNICNDSSFKNQSVCISSPTKTDGGCLRSNFDNSICVSVKGNYDYGCGGGNFTNGSICYALGGRTITGCNNATYDETSCCCGPSCGAAHRCPEDRCEPKYLNFTFE